MYCNKCGRQIEAGSKFCQFCGNIQEQKTGSNSIPPMKQGLIAGMSVVDILICLLFLILALWWTDIFLSNIKYTWQTFEILDKDISFLGMLIFAVPYVFMIFMCVVGVLGIKRHQYHISIGIACMVSCIIMKIGMLIFSEPSFGSFEIVVYKVFNVYGSIFISSMVLSFMVSGLVYAKMNHY